MIRSFNEDHQALSPEQLEPLMAAVEGAIIARGGRITIAYETHLYAARTTSSARLQSRRQV